MRARWEAKNIERPKGLRHHLRESRLLSAHDSSKRVLESHAIIVLPVVEVLRINFSAPELASGRDDRGIIVANLVSTTDRESRVEKLQRRFENGECAPLAAESQRFFMGEGQLPRRPGSHIKLQNLK